MKEDFVSLEIAQLLKEKGFSTKTHYYYDKDGDLIFSVWVDEAGKNDFIAPTLQMAMKWLREVFDLHVLVYPWRADKEEKAIHWCGRVYKSFNLFGYERFTDERPKSYEEACESAIKYCLEKLI